MNEKFSVEAKNLNEKSFFMEGSFGKEEMGRERISFWFSVE